MYLQIYNTCEEEFRLNESGNLNVPYEAIKLFCNGPCLSETHLVLDCVDKAFKDFLFINQARVVDLRNTINIGCQRGTAF